MQIKIALNILILMTNYRLFLPTSPYKMIIRKKNISKKVRSGIFHQNGLYILQEFEHKNTLIFICLLTSVNKKTPFFSLLLLSK